MYTIKHKNLQDWKNTEQLQEIQDMLASLLSENVQVTEQIIYYKAVDMPST